MNSKQHCEESLGKHKQSPEHPLGSVPARSRRTAAEHPGSRPARGRRTAAEHLASVAADLLVIPGVISAYSLDPL